MKSVGTRGERVLFETFLRGKWMVYETFLEVGMANAGILSCRILLSICLLDEIMFLRSYNLTVLQLYF